MAIISGVFDEEITKDVTERVTFSFDTDNRDNETVETIFDFLDSLDLSKVSKIALTDKFGYVAVFEKSLRLRDFNSAFASLKKR